MHIRGHAFICEIVFSSDNVPAELSDSRRLRFKPDGGDETDEEDYEKTSTQSSTTYTTTTTTTTTTDSEDTKPKNERLCEKYPDTLIGRILPNTSLDRVLRPMLIRSFRF